jgi:hypothetical protein
VKLDDRLKQLMKELGGAINESLSESDRIAQAISNIKSAGYDVFLVLEATIGFNKREDETALAESPKSSIETQVRFTSQDAKFLKALKITVDEENP